MQTLDAHLSRVYKHNFTHNFKCLKPMAPSVKKKEDGHHELVLGQAPTHTALGNAVSVGLQALG